MTRFVERDFSFHPDALNLQGNVRLTGYWQSEKYFADIADTLRNDFAFTRESTPQNEMLGNAIHSCNSVSLHLRRGDYVTNSSAAAFHGVCGLSYYQSAVQRVVERCDAPCLFVFSDDIEWAKANLTFEMPMTFISHNQGDQSFEDMRLMSFCKHNIIANSSFSWWGAWLNKNPEKMVVAPDRWFADATIDTRNLVPDSWIRL